MLKKRRCATQSSASAALGRRPRTRREVETEPVDAHRVVPVPKRVEDEVAREGRGEVRLVRRAGGTVDEPTRRRECVVLGRREAAERGEAAESRSPPQLPPSAEWL